MAAITGHSSSPCLGTRPADPRRCAFLPVRRDVLGLEKLQQSLVAAFASDTALLDPAERCGRVGDEAAVQADHARLDRLGDCEALGQVARVYIGRQSTIRPVRNGNRLVY